MNGDPLLEGLRWPRARDSESVLPSGLAVGNFHDELHVPKPPKSGWNSVSMQEVRRRHLDARWPVSLDENDELVVQLGDVTGLSAIRGPSDAVRALRDFGDSLQFMHHDDTTTVLVLHPRRPIRRATARVLLCFRPATGSTVRRGVSSRSWATASASCCPPRELVTMPDGGLASIRCA